MTPSELRHAIQKLKHVRGTQYYDNLKDICHHIADDFSNDVAIMRDHYGGLTPVGFGVLALRYDLNYKATLFAIETICNGPDHCLIYDKIITDGGHKVRDILAAAQELPECPVLAQSRWG